MSVESIVLSAGPVRLEGTLDLPPGTRGVVLFSHGSGSSRHSPRNRYVAQVLQDAGLGTLLFDLLSADEDADYSTRFDIDLLTDRLALAVGYVRDHPSTRRLQIGLFGASTGAASALRVAARMPQTVFAVVSRGGRPDLTGAELLQRVRSPTLLVVGGLDIDVLRLNEAACAALKHCEREIAIVPGATHLFPEAGALEQAADLATRWFLRHLRAADADAADRIGKPSR